MGSLRFKQCIKLCWNQKNYGKIKILPEVKLKQTRLRLVYGIKLIYIETKNHG